MTPQKRIIEHIRRDWYVYAALLLALFALLYTWNAQLTMEQTIRADYEDYIQQCNGDDIQWNGTLKPAYYTDSQPSSPSAAQASASTSYSWE